MSKKKNNNNWKQNDSKLDYQKAKIILYMNSKKTLPVKDFLKYLAFFEILAKVLY